MKHIVHVSGYSLRHNPNLKNPVGRPGPAFGDWEHVCWGDPKQGLLGRIPKALLRAFESGSEQTRIVWSTGSSAIEGVSEAEYLYNTALERLQDLRADFPDHFTPRRWYLAAANPSIISTWLRSLSMLETWSTDTATSMKGLASIIDEGGPGPVRVHLVSSRNHLSRVVRDAERMIKQDQDGRPVRPYVELEYSAADTCYASGNVGDTEVNDLGWKH